MSFFKSAFIESVPQRQDVAKVTQNNVKEYFSVSQNKSRVEPLSNSVIRVDNRNSPDLQTNHLLNGISLPKSHNPTEVLSSQYSRLRKSGNGFHTIFAPHGGAIEKQQNEERLNVQTTREMKIEPKAAFEHREKSIDLSIGSSKNFDGKQIMLTKNLINSNKLSKYLSSFIGGKDYRTTEERELDK